jgi:excisionase family DNA binding protein
MTEDLAKTSGGGGRGLPLKADMDKKLCVKVKEATAILGLPRNITYDLIKQGKLPMIKFGKRLLIPRAALEKMLEGGDK